MVISFGAPQVWTELAMNLEDDEWSDMVAEFGWIYSLSPEDKEHYSEGLLKEPNFNVCYDDDGLWGSSAKQSKN